MSWGFPAYVPVAKKRADAKREVARLRRKGLDVRPVVLEGRRPKIATTFWGQAWCAHLDRFREYEYRLPRGRSYVRNGQVVHLALEPGSVRALVSGASVYSVEFSVAPVTEARWSAVVDRCAGEIASLVDLLRGNLSGNVMRVVTDPKSGLFPARSEISFTCDCPDYAQLCKHVAAVFYGIGARLDQDPASLFRLRGADPETLIRAASGKAGDAAGKGSGDALEDDELSSVFGVEIDAGPAFAPVAESAASGATPARSAGAGASGPVEPGRTKRAASARSAPKPSPAVPMTERLLRGKRCYQDRTDGYPWRIVGLRNDYRSGAGASAAARDYALTFGEEWPIPYRPLRPADP